MRLNPASLLPSTGSTGDHEGGGATENLMLDVYLRQLHLHVSEDVEETNHGVPQAAVGQALLVPSARTLQDQQRLSRRSREPVSWC